MFKNCILLIAILFVTHLHGQQQCKDSTKRQRFQVGVGGQIISTFDSYLLLIPQVSYYYTPKRAISVGFIKDIGREIEKLSHPSGITSGIRNGFFVGHMWLFNKAKNEKLFWWINTQISYVQGDIAYRYHPVRETITYYAQSAIFETWEVILEKKWSRYFYTKISANVGVSFIYGSGIRQNLPNFGTKLSIGYGF